MAIVVLVILALSMVRPQPAAGEIWSTKGSMVTARHGHTATLLPNGKVLVAGGYNGSNLPSAEIYDPANGTWSATGSLTYGRSNHTATLLQDGKVLVAGGGPLQCELYDPALGGGSWGTTGSLNTGRLYHTATLLNSGKVLVAGGSGALSSAELYDPAVGGGTWSTTGSLSKGRYTHTATLLNTDQVLVAGGYNGGPLNSSELYDPAANGGVGAWSATGALANSRAEHTATLLPTVKVLVAGGYDDEYGNFLTSAEIYDPAANDGVGAWSTTGALANGRTQHTATLLPSGKVLVAAGLKGVSGSPIWLTSAELYDPGKSTWSATVFLTFKRGTHTATLLNSGQVLVAGGVYDTVPLSSAELYRHPDISAIINILLLN